MRCALNCGTTDSIEAFMVAIQRGGRPSVAALEEARHHLLLEQLVERLGVVAVLRRRVAAPIAPSPMAQPLSPR